MTRDDATQTIATHREAILNKLPYKELGQWPTPIDRVESLEAELGVSRLYIKRDDLSGELYGGNKLRKLEFLLADAIEQGYESTLTIGAIGSNHVLATCIYARELGLEPAAQHYPQPLTPHVIHNLKALSTTRPDLSLVGHPVALPFKLFKRKLTEWLSTREQSTYFITGGGSSPLGTVGYVLAGLEFAEQIARGELEEPDRIYVAAGTMGTLAGLMIGCKMAGLKTRVIGVRVVDKIVTNRRSAARLARRTAALMRDAGIGEVPELAVSDFEILDDYFGSAYGEGTAEGARAIEILEEHANLTLDPTYTGKAFSALFGEREAIEGARVVYWHTLSGADLGARIAGSSPARDLPASYAQFLTSQES